MKTITQIFALILLAANMGCSSETVDSDLVNPDAIHQDYKVSYYEGSNNTSVWAQFRLGNGWGDTIHLVEPSKLMVNGKKIHSTWFPILGTYYSDTVAMGFQQTVAIEWYNPESVLYRNEISMKPVTTVGPYTDVDVNSDYVVKVTTDPLASSESIDATIWQDQAASNGETHYVSVSGSFSPSKKTITFYSSVMKNKLVNGMAEIQITRIRNGRLQAATPKGGGQISSEYHSRPIPIEIVNGFGSSLAQNL